MAKIILDNKSYDIKGACKHLSDIFRESKEGKSKEDCKKDFNSLSQDNQKKILESNELGGLPKLFYHLVSKFNDEKIIEIACKGSIKAKISALYVLYQRDLGDKEEQGTRCRDTFNSFSPDNQTKILKNGSLARFPKLFNHLASKFNDEKIIEIVHNSESVDARVSALNILFQRDQRNLKDKGKQGTRCKDTFNLLSSDCQAKILKSSKLIGLPQLFNHIYMIYNTNNAGRFQVCETGSIPSTSGSSQAEELKNGCVRDKLLNDRKEQISLEVRSNVEDTLLNDRIESYVDFSIVAVKDNSDSNEHFFSMLEEVNKELPDALLDLSSLSNKRSLPRGQLDDTGVEHTAKRVRSSMVS